MQNKKGLIMGVANDRSIAWGIAKKLAEQGAEIALTYQGEALKKRVQPLAEEIGSNTIIPCDVSDSQSMNNVFEILKNQSGRASHPHPQGQGARPAGGCLADARRQSTGLVGGCATPPSRRRRPQGLEQRSQRGPGGGAHRSLRHRSALVADAGHVAKGPEQPGLQAALLPPGLVQGAGRPSNRHRTPSTGSGRGRHRFRFAAGRGRA